MCSALLYNVFGAMLLLPMNEERAFSRDDFGEDWSESWENESVELQPVINIENIALHSICTARNCQQTAA